MMRSSLSAIFAALLSGSIAAQTLTYAVDLTGAQEVPPATTSGNGRATVTLNRTTGAVSVSGSYQNLSSAASAAHIHGASRRGLNSGVIVGLTVSGGTTGTFSGSGTLTAAQITDMLEGVTYLNVHTGNFPGGEVRGQIDSVPGSGSPNATLLSISGSATPGGMLQVSCPPTINRAVIVFGLPLPPGQTGPFPAGLACMAPTALAFDLAVPPIVVGTSSTTVTIPSGLPAGAVAIQCAMVPPAANCIDFSIGARVAIR